MKSLKVTKPVFGVPRRDVLDRIDASDKVARLSEAGYAFATKLRDLERQFEASASELRDGYLAEVCEINDGPDAEATQVARTPIHGDLFRKGEFDSRSCTSKPAVCGVQKVKQFSP